MTQERDDRPGGVTPVLCPFGHRLGPGRIRLGWQPCQCPTAIARHRGHTTYVCEACARSGWTTTAYRPEHIRTEAEVERGLAWLRAQLTRLEAAPGAQASPLRAEAARYRRAVRATETSATTRHP